MNRDGLGPRNLPDGEPDETADVLGPTEERLRRALDEDARSITPTERLETILGEARGESGGASGTGTSAFSDVPPQHHRRWLLPAAAAAAALLVAGTVWAVNRPSGQVPAVAGSSTTAATPTASPTGPSTGPSSIPTQTAEQPSPSPSGGSATVVTTVPVYYLGPVTAGGTVRLFREFVPTDVPAPATDAGTALAALRLAMGTPPPGSSYQSAWSGVTATSVTLGADAITVRLSSGTGAAQPLATEQLVWTVQAALGRALPVRFQLADGGAQVSPGHPATSSYTRPTDPMAVLLQVAPIWVDEPARGSVVKAGAPLTVKGVASTFEATVLWELLRDGAPVDKGFTTAAQSAPARAAYTFTTKPLPAGDYVLRVYATSPGDGSTTAEQRVPLTAR